MKIKTLIGTTLCGLALSYAPAQAANSEAYASAGKELFGVTVEEPIQEIEADLEYFVRNDKTECRLTFKFKILKERLELLDKGCNKSIDVIRMSFPQEVGNVELARDKAHEVLFKQADKKYNAAITEYKLQEKIDVYFRVLEHEIDHLLNK